MNGFIEIDDSKKEDYNKVVTHPLQSFEWGEFRKKTGIKIVRRGLIKDGDLIDGFTLTLHKIPKLNYYIGYLPKGKNPTKELLEELLKIGEAENCIFIQLEPNIEINTKWSIKDSKFNIKPAAHPLFTKYTFVLDLQKSEEELLAEMHPKTRYNIRVANKHNVKIIEDNSEASFKSYYKLMEETTSRQKFYAHTKDYHKFLWQALPKEFSQNSLSYHLLNANFKEKESKNKTLTSWVLFSFHDFLYYPYGASSRENREVMANNLIAWEAIKLGKKMGLKYFDMWGALGPDPDTRDPWYGFHKFKQGYGAKLVEFVGSYDLVINPAFYELYKISDKLRWLYLKVKK